MIIFPCFSFVSVIIKTEQSSFKKNKNRKEVINIMEINNYYKTLTSKQKEKLKERTAFSVYYEWLDQLEAVHLTYEQRGIIFTAIGFYARTNGTEKLPADLAERIESEPLLLFIFNTYMNTTERATKQWINLRSKRKTNKEEEDTTSTESPLKCPTMPQSIKEGHDTTPPPENEEDEEKEEIKSYVVATGKYKMDGLSIQEIYEQDPEWIKQMAKNRNPENEVAKKDIEFIREFIKVILNKDIEEDTSTELPLKCPTMPQGTKEGKDTTAPPEDDLKAKNEAIETYGHVMDINQEDGVLFMENGITYTFNQEENPNITDFIEKFVVITHNSKNEIINIEEDTPF